MASQGTSTAMGRKSTRLTKASDKAVENVVQLAGKKAKRKQKEAPATAKAPPKKRGNKPSKTKKNASLVPAGQVGKDNITTPDATQSTSGEKSVEELVRDACVRLIPSIVTNVMNSTQHSETEDAESVDFTADSDEDMSDPSDVEDNLRTAALASRRQRDSVPYVPAQPADLLPALDAKIVRKIKKGEFIDLALCLPSFSPHSKAPVVTPTVNSNGDPAWRLESSVGRGKIRDFSDWMVAWNAFSRCASYYFPAMTRQFLFYQSEITNLARLNNFGSVLSYDQAFRTRIANKEVLRWDYHDNELRSALLVSLTTRTTSPRTEVHCWSCRQPGHVATNCPWRSNPTSTRDNNPAGDDPISPPPFLAPQQPGFVNTNSIQTTRSAAIPPQRTNTRDVCHFWNTVKGCAFKQCKFEHRCEKCKSRQHNLVFCPRRHEH